MLAPVHTGDVVHTYQAGWEALVAPLGGARLLCLDDGMLAVDSLASRCERICVLCGTERAAATMRERIGRARWANVAAVSLTNARELEALRGNRFQGAVLCDLSGTAQAGVPGGLPMLVDIVRPLLEEGAFVLVGTPNRWGLSRSLGLRRLRYAWSSPGLEGLVRRAGARHGVVHPVILNDANGLSESITSRGYVATKNRGLTRERIKEWLWGARTARWFAPALMAVGWVGSAQDTVIELIGQSLAGDEALTLAQYLAFLSGKVIVSFARASAAEPSQVVVISRDPLTVSRRTREASILRHLVVSLPPRLAALLPAVLDRFTVDGGECFVLRHVPGVTADAVVPGLARVTYQAHRFLLDLHAATARCCTLDDARWTSGLGAVFAAAIQRHPVVGDELRTIDRMVRERAVGGDWVDVCSHGDFKIENVMYDPADFHLTGVIDWEHALLPGWPYVDTAYLLAYNRTLRGATWAAGALELVEGRFDADERRIDAEYWAAIGLPKPLIPVCRAAAVVHHLGCRWHGDWEGEALDELRALLDAVTKSLHAEAPTRAAPRLAEAPAPRSGGAA